MRRQKAVYWAKAGFDDFGQPKWSGPVQIACRWEDVRVEFIDSRGTKQISQSVVYVDRVMPEGGVLMRGELADVTNPVNPKENENAWEIRHREELPNLKNTENLYTVYL